MKLAVFDIDGTLTQTNQADGLAFRSALKNHFGFGDESSDWSTYRTSTDSGIFHELFERHKSRPPTPNEIKLYKEAYVDELKKVHRAQPLLIREVLGAASVLKELQSHAAWRVSIATGAWSATAYYKLKSAQLPFEVVPIATADDDFERPKILQKSIERAKKTYAVEEFERVVYLGDGVWDLAAARDLKIPFVGITADRHSEHGFEAVAQKLDAYRDLNRLFEALESATIPS